jgi:hypothetical protein
MEDPAVVTFLGKSILKYRQRKISFVPQTHLYTGKSVSGGWASTVELRIATNRPVIAWLEIFVHETCHIDQQISKPEWYAVRERAIGEVDDWLKKKRVADISGAIKLIIELERDCEARAIRKIRRNKLPIDIKTYAKIANAYILGYHWIEKNRRWCKKSYETCDIWMQMPDKLLTLGECVYPPHHLIELYD